MKKVDMRSKQGRAIKAKQGREKPASGISMILNAEHKDRQNTINSAMRKMLDSLPEHPTPKPTILQEAHDLIYGDKEAEYGHPKKNLQDIANFWEMYLYGKYGATHPIYAEDVCQMMVLLKMARGFNGPRKRDTIVDQCGYSGLLERLQEPAP